MREWLSDPNVKTIPRSVIEFSTPLPLPASEGAVRAVLAGDNYEQLLELPSQLNSLPVYQIMGLEGVSNRIRLRKGLLDRLLQAQQALPVGFGLVVLDGWRTMEFQSELLRHYRSTTTFDLSGYVSDPADPLLMAPHTTGGAVDLSLCFEGHSLALGTDFDDFTQRAGLLSFESSDLMEGDVVAKSLRRLLGSVLVDAGLAPYPLEWWHWSYGEQRWAAQYGKTTTLYSPVIEEGAFGDSDLATGLS